MFTFTSNTQTTITKQLLEYAKKTSGGDQCTHAESKCFRNIELELKTKLYCSN